MGHKPHLLFSAILIYLNKTFRVSLKFYLFGNLPYLIDISYGIIA